jgi:acetolactate synthase-1/3 small subunit
MALFKIVANSVKIKKALNACKKYNPVILDQTNKSAVIQITALRREIDKMAKNLNRLVLLVPQEQGLLQ